MRYRTYEKVKIIATKKRGISHEDCYKLVQANSKCGSWFEVSHDDNGWCMCYPADQQTMIGCGEYFKSDGGENLFRRNEGTTKLLRGNHISWWSPGYDMVGYKIEAVDKNCDVGD